MFRQVAGRMSEFKTSAVFSCSAEALRRFLGRPANLPDVTDPELELEIIAAPDEVAVGATIEFRVTAYGFKQRATHQYVEVSPLRIAETQLDGPMRAWTHVQSIEPLGENECRLTDSVTFERPGGMLGFVLTEARMQESLNEGMTCKHQALVDLISRGAIR
jgi:ligand-binding SRPBCC domain-containing protein